MECDLIQWRSQDFISGGRVIAFRAGPLVCAPSPPIFKISIFRTHSAERPPPFTCTTLSEFKSESVHQLRAGQLSGYTQYLRRIDRNPLRHCPQCEDGYFQGARRPLCRQTADAPYHVLVECPALMGTRL